MTDTYIDNDDLPTYTENDLKSAVQSVVSMALSQMLPLLANLDNRIGSSRQEGLNMPSQYRQTYSYTDSQGVLQSIQLGGSDHRETDLRFQNMLAMAQPEPKAPTLIEFVDSTFRESFIDNLADTTQSSYNYYLEKLIFPYLGRIPMNELTVANIQSWYDWLAHGSRNGFVKDICKRTIDRAGGLLGRILTVAKEMHVIPDSPYKPILLRNHGVPSHHHKAVTDEEVDRIRAAVPLLTDRRERLYAALLVYTGMRREEILGLQWEHIYLDAGYGDIVKVVVYPDNKRTVVKDHPKTACSERSFIIPAPLLEILQPEQRESGFVIEGKTLNQPVSISTFQRTSRAVFRKLGMTNYNNHDWRATFATQLKESGLTSAQVADLLGHADTRMVETVYATARREGILKYRNAVNAISSSTKKANTNE